MDGVLHKHGCHITMILEMFCEYYDSCYKGISMLWHALLFMLPTLVLYVAKRWGFVSNVLFQSYVKKFVIAPFLLGEGKKYRNNVAYTRP
jgi:hypothetical protein